MRLQPLFAILALFPAAILAQTIKVITPPKTIILNDRSHTIQVSYSDVVGQGEVHVDLLGNGGTWLGGGMESITPGAGVVDVPYEVRVPLNYVGPLTLKTSLTPAGSTQKVAVADDIEGLTVDPTPVDAIGVLCNPSVVSMGSQFNLNLWYTQTHKRPNKLIAVALDANTKQYYGGFEMDIFEQQGQLTGRFDLKWGDRNLPLKFKAWIGGQAPDYDSYTMVDIKLGDNVQNACPDIGKQMTTPDNLPPANWIDIIEVPATIAKGDSVTVKVEYNLFSQPEAELQVSLQSWDWTTHESKFIAGTTSNIQGGHLEGSIKVPIPADAQDGRDGCFFVAYLLPVGGTYATRLGEDRNYNTKFGGQTSQGGNNLRNAWNNKESSFNDNRNQQQQQQQQQQPQQQQQQPPPQEQPQQQQQQRGGIRGWVASFFGGR